MAEPASQDFRVERVNVLGVGLSALKMDPARKATLRALDQKQRGYICVRGVERVTEAGRGLGDRGEAALAAPGA